MKDETKEMDRLLSEPNTDGILTNGGDIPRWFSAIVLWDRIFL
jgi:hypothetical protein